MKKLISKFVEDKKVRDVFSVCVSLVLLIASSIAKDFNIFIYGSLINFLVFFLINTTCKNYLKQKIISQLADYNIDNVDNNVDNDIK